MRLRKYPARSEVFLVCLDPTVGSEMNETQPVNSPAEAN